MYNEAMKELLPDLVEPIKYHTEQGTYLNYWFEKKNPNYPESTNAEIFLGAVYKLAGTSNSKISDYMEKFHLGQYRLVVEAIYWFGYVRDYEKVPVPKEKEVEVEKWVDVEVQVPDPKNPNKTITTIEKQKQIDKVTVEYEELEWKELPYTNPKTGKTYSQRHYVAPNADKVKWVYGTIREIAAFEKSQVGTEDFRKGTGMDYVSDSCQYGTK